MASYLASYRPLALRHAGRLAVEQFGLPPFLDGSCRREPDFESAFPSISALCRGRLFAPRLQVGDTIIYLAVKAQYPGWKERVRRLVAVLCVEEHFATHSDAADWYRARGLPLPSNCWVPNNPPIPYELTVQDRDLKTWDKGYRARARRWPTFLATRPLFLDLRTPPIVTDAMLIEAFGRVPGLQNPPRVGDTELATLLNLCAPLPLPAI